MALYTDGVIRASKDQIAEALAAFDDEEVALREATATELQVEIDADAKLKSAGLVASVDDADNSWVVVTLPTDSGTPLFWAGQADLIVEGKGQFVEQRVDVLDDDGDPTGEKTGAWKIRMGRGRWSDELKRISALL